MDGEQQPVYEQYPSYKDVRGVNFFFLIFVIFFQLMVKTPIEIADNIMNEIAEYVTSNLKVNTVGTSFARLLRETLDRKFGPAWHVFVGKNFGCFAVHDTNCFVNFKYKGFTYLVYKTTI